MSSSDHIRFKQALARVRHFEDLPAAVQDELADSAVYCQFPSGELIYMEGEPAQKMYILDTGWVKSTRVSMEGREQALLFLRDGEIFGDISLFAGAPYPCTVTALEPVKVWSIDKDTLDRLVQQHPEFAQAVIRRLSERVIHFVGIVEDLALHSVESRLAGTLIKHAVHDGDRLVVPRRAWTTFDEMAVRLGTVRDVLARALRSLEQEGLIQVDKQSITILDLDGLTERGNS